MARQEPYQITQAYLDPTSQNRPGRCDGNACWQGVQGIVVHRTASSTMDAWAIRRYFNDAPDGRYASSQFVLDNNVILQLMPVGEVAFHTRGKNQTHLGIETCEHNWGTTTWPETYRKLVWLTGYLVRTYQLSIKQVTGHFWWDKVNRPYDPTYMGWDISQGKATGIFDWNQFIADVQAEVERPEPVQVQVRTTAIADCTEGLLIGSTTYVPIRPYTACIAPDATIEWDGSGPTVTVSLSGGSAGTGASDPGVSAADTGEYRKVDILIKSGATTDCTDGLLIGSTTYVPIRPYTACLRPDAAFQWDGNNYRVLVDLSGS